MHSMLPISHYSEHITKHTVDMKMFAAVEANCLKGVKAVQTECIIAVPETHYNNSRQHMYNTKSTGFNLCLHPGVYSKQ